VNRGTPLIVVQRRNAERRVVFAGGAMQKIVARSAAHGTTRRAAWIKSITLLLPKQCDLPDLPFSKGDMGISIRHPGVSQTEWQKPMN